VAADAKIGVYIGSDTDVIITGLKDETTDTHINDATVTCTVRIYTESAMNTSGEGAEAVFDSLTALAMTYETASNGKYVGLIPDTAAFVPGTKYWLDITVTTTGGTVLRVRKLSEATFYGTKRR
tara:strand:+ start:1853 stop:2224 length:372 start_codon:yes stop_codon:yes gene_type:complete